jgi:hypothetical protein
MQPVDTKRIQGRKRAFFLHWNPDELRFRRDWYTKQLAEQEPELMAEVEMWFTLNRDLDYIRREFGLGDEEIEAERDRLMDAREANIEKKRERKR